MTQKQEISNARCRCSGEDLKRLVQDFHRMSTPQYIQGRGQTILMRNLIASHRPASFPHFTNRPEVIQAAGYPSLVKLDGG